MKKVVFITTLNAIRKKHPCSNGWAKLLSALGKTEADGEPINLLTILKSNGAQDMLWALQCVKHPELDRVARLMACDFAEAVLPIWQKKSPSDKRPENAIAVARRYANGKATDEERAAAWAAARAAAWAAAGDAARAAAGDAAWAAAGDAEGDAAGDAQLKIIKKYLALK